MTSSQLDHLQRPFFQIQGSEVLGGHKVLGGSIQSGAYGETIPFALKLFLRFSGMCRRKGVADMEFCSGTGGVISHGTTVGRWAVGPRPLGWEAGHWEAPTSKETQLTPRGPGSQTTTRQGWEHSRKTEYQAQWSTLWLSVSYRRGGSH